jgi:hypothetical protein
MNGNKSKFESSLVFSFTASKILENNLITKNNEK